MKKTIIIAVTLFMACLTFNACGKKQMSIDELKSQIKAAILDEAKGEGSALVVTDFTLNDEGNGDFRGKVHGVKDDTLSVVYDIVVKESADDYDAEWNLVNDSTESTVAPPDSVGN